MTKTHSMLLVALALAGAAPSLAETAKSPHHTPVENLKWFATGIGPVQGAIAYGDMAKGPYGIFLKFPGGFSTPIHQHSAEYRAVVVGGTVVNSEEGATDITMQPGSSWYQRGNAHHVTKCVSSADCMIFLTQTGKFDFLPKKGG